MKKCLIKLINLIRRVVNCFDRRKPKLASIEETIDVILNEKASISRFGDGEFKWMNDIPQNSFQTQSNLMKERLKEVFYSNINNLLICIPNAFYDLNIYTTNASEWWLRFSLDYKRKWNSMIDFKRQYYNLNITRPYLDFKDKTKSDFYFLKIKKIWKDRNLLIVEGSKTRFGVGNDLISCAHSVRRILCPATNAFSYYDEILSATKKAYKEGDLVLIALGPTATILSYDLCKNGIQALDIGHLDIEYEWYLKKADKKIPIKGKYVNEASKSGGNTPDDSIVDDNYLNSIIETIG